ncbi:MAG: hypothetical protein DIZ78_01255 [endosymbiont of Escarpia spicata]|uniref:Thrombospondin n=1 Tax=endosymbiont of Escarpia spicata TaxID=2200908 RepID=A0A370DTM1_9GAMM|nr:MAG: hypothetical protein DIZ78_01255 [endosymbiont of Escarpia spicata]
MSKKPFGTLLLLAAFVAGSAGAVEPDSDHDGVADALDRCPNTAQLKKLPADFKYATAVNQERLKPGPRAYPVDAHDCEPDNDGDGIVNSRDYCPEDTPQTLSKGIAPNGCPKHSDFDGTPDYRDNCPNTPRGIKTDALGCPAGNADS